MNEDVEIKFHRISTLMGVSYQRLALACLPGERGSLNKRLSGHQSRFGWGFLSLRCEK